MTLLENVKLGVLAVAIVVGAAASSDAQGHPPMRQHTATEMGPLQLVKASKNAGRSKVTHQTEFRDVTPRRLCPCAARHGP